MDDGTQRKDLTRFFERSRTFGQKLLNFPKKHFPKTNDEFKEKLLDMDAEWQLTYPLTEAICLLNVPVADKRQ